MKKITHFFLLLTLMTLGVSPFTAFAGTYTDVHGHWAEPAILYVTAEGLFSGATETEFKPNQPITRGMLISVLGRLADVSKSTEKSPFWDVEEAAYYAPYVTWAASLGIVSGLGNGQFAPDAPITREQLCVIFIRYAKIRGIALTNSQTADFKDADQIDGWAKKAVASMQASGLISGDSKGNFNPKKSTTRAEAAVILQLFMERK